MEIPAATAFSCRRISHGGSRLRPIAGSRSCDCTHRCFSLGHARRHGGWAGTVLGILLLEGFVVTTLDVAVRLNRYLLEEIWKFLFREPHPVLRSAWFNTTICVGLMFLLSRTNTLPMLWQVFGSANQMMGAMALLVAAVWLRDNGRRYVFVLIPSILMFATTLASTSLSLLKNQQLGNWPLVIACGVLILLGAGVAVLGTRVLLSPRRSKTV